MRTNRQHGVGGSGRTRAWGVESGEAQARTSSSCFPSPPATAPAATAGGDARPRAGGVVDAPRPSRKRDDAAETAARPAADGERVALAHPRGASALAAATSAPDMPTEILRASRLLLRVLPHSRSSRLGGGARGM